MSDMPLAIDRVDRVRGESGGIRLRLTGRWTVPPGRQPAAEPLLVVALDGRRHRFPPVPAPPHGAEGAPPGAFEATFVIPDWAEPRVPGQAALWIDDAVVPVPPPGAGASAAAPPAPPAVARVAPSAPVRLPAPPALGEAAPWPPQEIAAGSSAGTVNPESVFDSGRTGPLAELLFKESVSALHTELEERSAEAARLRGALADAQAELETRSRTQAALETAQEELRQELERLAVAAGGRGQEHDRALSAMRGRVADLETRLSAAERERDAARGQLGAERDRRGAEQAEHDRRHAGELESRDREHTAEIESLQRQRAAEIESLARRHAEEVATLREQHDHELSGIREHIAALNVSRDAAASEVGGLRTELDRLGTELAVVREQLTAGGGDLGEAQRLLAEARALGDQLRAQSPQ